MHFYIDKLLQWIIDWAAKTGNIEMLIWPKKNGDVFDEDTFAVAAYNGSLETMVWLLDNEYSWNEETFFAAAHHGSLENMKWLKEHGCPASRTILVFRSSRNDETIISWKKSIGYCIFDRQ